MAPSWFRSALREQKTRHLQLHFPTLTPFRNCIPDTFTQWEEWMAFQDVFILIQHHFFFFFTQLNKAKGAFKSAGRNSNISSVPCGGIWKASGKVQYLFSPRQCLDNRRITGFTLSELQMCLRNRVPTLFVSIKFKDFSTTFKAQLTTFSWLFFSDTPLSVGSFRVVQQYKQNKLS